MSDSTQKMVDAKAVALHRIESAQEAVEDVIVAARHDRWTIIEHSEAVDARDLLKEAFGKVHDIRDDPKPRDPRLIP